MHRDSSLFKLMKVNTRCSIDVTSTSRWWHTPNLENKQKATRVICQMRCEYKSQFFCLSNFIFFIPRCGCLSSGHQNQQWRGLWSRLFSFRSSSRARHPSISRFRPMISSTRLMRSFNLWARMAFWTGPPIRLCPFFECVYTLYFLLISVYRFVEFFAPWCKHCQHLAPTLRFAIEATHDALQKADVRVAQLDCDKYGELCQKEEVMGYPTLKLYEPGKDPKGEEYTGNLSLESLITYFNKTATAALHAKQSVPPPPIEKVEPPAPVSDIKKELMTLTSADFTDKIADGVWFIKFYAPWCGHVYTHPFCHFWINIDT